MKVLLTENQILPYQEQKAIEKKYKEQVSALEVELKKYMDKVKDQDKRTLIFNAFQKRFKLLFTNYSQSQKQLYAKYGEQVYAMQGDINAKYLYHYTSVFNTLNIIEENEIYPNQENDSIISFSTNANLWKTGFTFTFGNERHQGVTDSNTPVRIEFDFNKLKEKYKYGKGNESVDTHVGEEEIYLKVNGESLTPIIPYIVSVLILKAKMKSGETEQKDLLELERILIANNIQYKIR